MGIGIIFIVVFVYIVAKAILRDNNKRGTSGRSRNDSADSFFFTGNGADLTPGDSQKHHSGHPHHDGNNGNGSHNNHSHGGSSWGSGHGNHGGWDGGGHSGGHDSGGFGGGDSGGGGGDGGGGGGGD